MDKLNRILNYREEGLSYNEIAKKIGCSKSLVAVYCNNTEHEKREKKKEQQLEYETIICQIIKESNNINQVCKKIGKKPTNTNYFFIKKIISKYNIDISHFSSENNICNKNIRYNDSEIYCENSPYTNSNSLKKRIIKTGLKEEKCECCGLTHWNDVPIPLELHHKNGKHNDNRIENLQLICPNCHATTENYCGRNKEKKIKVKTNNIINDIDKEIDLIIKYAKEKCNFTYIGKQMGLTDNGVRKRCKKYGLPYKTQDLKKYIES